MQKLLNSLVGIFVLMLFLSSLVYSQPGHKMKERIAQMKKMKMLEVLNLDEKQADAFMVKYSSIEKKIEEKKSNLDIAIEDLESSVRRTAGNDEIKSKTQKVENLQGEMLKTLEESRNSIRSILNEENYAKYLIFEHKFKDEVQKIIMKRMKEKRGE